MAKEEIKKKKSEEETEEKAETIEKEETVKETESEKEAESEEAKEPTPEEKLTEELKKQKESYLRLAAEYENYRKRTQQEKLGIYDDATAKTVEQLLPMADALQMAMQNSEGAPQEFLKGLEMIQTQFKTSMEKLKVESFGEIGDEFDPNLHNAIAKVESDELGENQLSMIYQKGFKIGDKIIRHAMVQVANCD
ncbi:MAG: nucleotide exchange factor GrpE [Oscillospiraceae bacterium]|nr:nucleotide exchange factor GrpE [Oscillospiraceae bacterium]